MHASNGIEISDAFPESCRTLIDPSLLALLNDVHGTFGERRHDLLLARTSRQQLIDDGHLPEFAAASSEAWAVAGIPDYLADRRAELYTTADAAVLTAALNARPGIVVASVKNLLPVPGAALAAQRTLHDCARDNNHSSRHALLACEPRTLDQEEQAIRWQGQPAAAALVDVASYLHLNAASLTAGGRAVTLRLPEIDSADEATFWSEVLAYLQARTQLAAGSIKLTAGIDSVNGAFAIDGILHGLRDYVTAISSDYQAVLRNFIRTFQELPQFVLPDRAEVSRASHFLRYWGLNLVQCAHRREVYAIAGNSVVSASEVTGGNPGRHWQRARYERLARDGFDGCSVSRPEALELASMTFERLLPDRHQLERHRQDVHVTAADLLQVVKGRITEEGLRNNIRLALQGKIALLAASANARDPGIGMSATSTATSVALAADHLWQSVALETGVLDDGRIIDEALFSGLLEAEAAELPGPPAAQAPAAGQLLQYVLCRELTGHFLAPAA